MALLTEAELTVIKNRSEIAGVQHRLSTSTARCTVCKNPWPCKKAMEYESDFSLEDIDLLLADIKERTRLLREVMQRERFLQHKRMCASTFRPSGACGCGRDALLAEVQKAIEAQP